MIDGPHIRGASPVALFINPMSAFASARLVGSANSLTNDVTLTAVGLVLLNAIVCLLPPGWNLAHSRAASRSPRPSVSPRFHVFRASPFLARACLMSQIEKA